MQELIEIAGTVLFQCGNQLGVIGLFGFTVLAFGDVGFGPPGGLKLDFCSIYMRESAATLV